MMMIVRCPSYRGIQRTLITHKRHAYQHNTKRVYSTSSSNSLDLKAQIVYSTTQNDNAVITPKESHGLLYRFPPLTHSSHLLVAREKSIVGMSLIDFEQFREIRIHSPSYVLPPKLAYNLDRVIQDPGVHPLQSFSSHHYNFSPYLKFIHQPSEVQLEKLSPFITTSRDTTLHKLAKEHFVLYKGSTSSTTSALSLIYFALSHYKPVQVSMLSALFQVKTHWSGSFTPGITKPISLYLRHHDGIFSVDSDQGTTARDNQILLDLGKTLEKALTTETDEFEKYLKKNNDHSTTTHDKTHQESYCYLKIGKSLLRSQIDCHSPHLPAEKNTFDLKTRASSAIRIDVKNYARNTNYRIVKLTGSEKSYEKEYFDMIRSSFLKYYFQTRIGHMAGIFVAYHNTRELFGFEYISTNEIAETVFGNLFFAEASFKITNYLFQVILDGITSKLGSSKTIRLTLATDKTNYVVNIFAIQVENDPGWSEPQSSSVNTPYYRSETRAQKLKRYQKQVDSVNTPVFWFQLDILTIINGIKVHGHVSLCPEDSYQVYYKLKEMNSEKTLAQVLESYTETLRLSKLYNEFEE